MKLLLFDDHKLFAKSLEIVIGPHVSSIKTYPTPENILDIIKEEQPDLVILDVHMGAYSGLDVGRDILYHYPALKVTFLSGYNLPAYNLEAKKMGVKGFLDKNVSIEELIRDIERIRNGEEVFMASPIDVIEELTHREKEILQCASNGDTQQAIADTLHISRRTVNNHLMSINEKLMVSSTVAAIVKGIELGIIKLQNNR